MKTEREQKFITTWEKQRKQKWKYLFIHGSLRWGVTTAVLITLTDIFGLDEIFNLKHTLVRILAFMIVGITFGFYSFNQRENRYKALMNETEE